MSDSNQNRIQKKMARLIEASIDVSTCVVEGEEYKGKKVKVMQASVATQIVRAMAPKVQGDAVGGLHLHLNVPRPSEVKSLKDSAPAKIIEAKADTLDDEAQYSSVKSH